MPPPVEMEPDSRRGSYYENGDESHFSCSWWISLASPTYRPLMKICGRESCLRSRSDLISARKELSMKRPRLSTTARNLWKIDRTVVPLGETVFRFRGSSLLSIALQDVTSRNWMGRYMMHCLSSFSSPPPTSPHGRSAYAFITHLGLTSDHNTQHSLITIYSRCGLNASARQMFDGIPTSLLDQISFNSMISRYSKLGFAREAVKLFTTIRELRFPPNEMTMVSAPAACGDLGDVSLLPSLPMRPYG